MSQDFSLLDKIYELIEKENYGGLVKFLKEIETEEKRKELCVVALTIVGMKKCTEEYGEIRVTPDKEKYERAKMGMEDISLYNILYTKDFNKDSELEGIETMIDFVPEDNPLKRYWRENFVD